MAFQLLHRFVVSPDTVAAVWQHCDRTQDYVFIGAKKTRPQRLLRATLRGVPAKRLDLALLEQWDGRSFVAVEIGNKTGRFDGAVRTQIVVRHWFDRRPANLPPFGWMRIQPDEDESGQHIVIAAEWAGGSWLDCQRRLKSDLVGYDLERLVLWHWTRYYRFLDRETAEGAARTFEAIYPEVRLGTLAEANRMASRHLYQTARDLGWVKLTSKQQRKFGVEGQWHRQDAIFGPVEATAGDPYGVGQYTRESARANREPREGGPR